MPEQRAFEFSGGEAPPEPPAPIVLGDSRVYVGTCGYSYRDWVGNFYPAGTRPQAMLPFYAARFPAVEIDASYYRVPSLATFDSMAARTPPEFRFAVKMPGSVTHLPADETRSVPDDARLLAENLQPLLERGKLCAVLLQFPHSFKPSAATQAYLGAIRAALPGLPLVAEFRNREWQRPETLELLDSNRIGWCNVDEPQFEKLLQPSSDVVGPLAYVRMHGRNAKNWWKAAPTSEARFDYLYTEDELQPWTDRIADMAGVAKETFVLFNNHRIGQAASNAALLARMLKLKFDLSR